MASGCNRSFSKSQSFCLDAYTKVSFAKKLEKQLPPVDYAVLKSSDRIKIWHQISIESMRQGVKGTAWDVQLYLQKWDFSLDGIYMPLRFFHGEQDMTIPISLAKQVVMELPTAQLATYPEEGHISLIANQFETIAKSLVNDI